MSLAATLSVGCSALFTDDLAGNDGSVAGAAGSAPAGAAGAKAGGAGSAGAGTGGAKQGGSGGSAGANPGGSGGASSGSGGKGGANVGGEAGASGGSAGQTQAGQSGSAQSGGKGGSVSGAGGQNGGASGANAAGTGGASGIAGTAGVGASSGAGGTAPNGGSSGSAATAGSGGVGASGGSASGGGAGAAGNTNCPQLPTGVPTGQPACGNGVVDPGEECDVGGGSSEDGCSPQCAITCTSGVRVGNSCYAVSNNTYRGGQVFDTPSSPGVTTGVLFSADFENEQACQHLVGPTSHIAILNRTGEREALAASPAFLSHLSAGVTGGTKNGSAWIGMGYRWLNTSTVTDVSRWFWSEGGLVDSSLWATFYPKAENGGGGPGVGQPDGCGSVNGTFQLENHDCDGDRRPVLCEREPGCAMRATGGGPWQIGYQGQNGHCYVRLTQQTTYENAINLCKNLGAHLAAFETIAEVRALPGVTAGLSDVWTGARRNACPKGNVGDAFVWGTNGAIVPTGLDDPGYWVPGEPNNLNGQEMCATMTRGHGLNDESCTATFRPLCERDY